jgi:hypothetical protein
LAASGFVLPHHITLDMPWSSSPPCDQSTTQSEPPECEICGLVGDAAELTSPSRSRKSDVFEGALRER